VKFTALLLAVALLGVQGQFWFGRASVSEVSQLRQKLDEQVKANAQGKQQLVRLRAELKDLREGLEMVEEKARGELGLIEPDEIFVPLK
jgi:cell division protein FtsB